MKFTTVVAAALPVLAAAHPTARDAHPTARDAHNFLELDLPQPHNYVADPVFAGQELSKNIARAPGGDYTEETWTEYAKQLCYDTPACTTFNSYLCKSASDNAPESY